MAQLFDLRLDRDKHHYSVVINVRDAGLHGHAWATWTRHETDATWLATSFGYFAEMDSYREVFDTTGRLIDETTRTLPATDVTHFAMIFWLDED